MATGKKSFILYSDQKELFEHLTDEQAGKLIKHIFKYVNDENPETQDPFINLAFITIKASLKRDLSKWEKQIKQRSEAGKKSAESRKRKSTSVNERARNSTDSVNVSVSVNDNVNDNVNEAEKEFIIFWNKYKKKVDRPKCLNKFLKLKEADVKKILIMVDKYVESTPDVKYRKNPLTWLNGECWNDEIINENTKEVVQPPYYKKFES